MLQCIFNYLYRNRRKWKRHLTLLFLLGALFVYFMQVVILHWETTKKNENLAKELNGKIKYLKKNLEDIEYIRGTLRVHLI